MKFLHINLCYFITYYFRSIYLFSQLIYHIPGKNTNQFNKCLSARICKDRHVRDKHTFIATCKDHVSMLPCISHFVFVFFFFFPLQTFFQKKYYFGGNLLICLGIASPLTMMLWCVFFYSISIIAYHIAEKDAKVTSICFKQQCSYLGNAKPNTIKSYINFQIHHIHLYTINFE